LTENLKIRHKIWTIYLAELLKTNSKMGSHKSSDNFCIKWQDYEANLGSGFRELRKDSEFFDVTLCCDNGVDKVQAHKLILASCSPLFRRILSNNAEKPLLYLKGINKRELTAVLNFMYHGEVNVAEDSLNVFLAVAEELAIKGLATNVTTRFDGSSSASAPAEIFSASYDEQIKQAFLTGKNLGKSPKMGKKRSAPLSDSEGGMKHLKSEPTDGSDDETSDVFQAADGDDNDFSYEDGFNVIKGEAAEEHLRRKQSGNMKKYKQAFREEWLELPEFGSWLQRDPNSGERAWCSICESQMAAKHSSLLAHSKSEKHMKCLGERYAIETVANLMKRKDGKKSDEIREMLKMEDGDNDSSGVVAGDEDYLDDKK